MTHAESQTSSFVTMGTEALASMSACSCPANNASSGYEAKDACPTLDFLESDGRIPFEGPFSVVSTKNARRA